jgi:hypothetical protein
MGAKGWEETGAVGAALSRLPVDVGSLTLFWVANGLEKGVLWAKRTLSVLQAPATPAINPTIRIFRLLYL